MATLAASFFTKSPYEILVSGIFAIAYMLSTHSLGKLLGNARILPEEDAVALIRDAFPKVERVEMRRG